MTVRKKREGKKASLLCTAKHRVELVTRNSPHAAHSQAQLPHSGSEGQRTGRTERSLAPIGTRRYAVPHRSVKTLGW